MLRRLNLIHNSHTGRLRPHEHTSYLLLGVLLLIVGVTLSAYTAFAVGPHPDPQLGSIGLTGAVPGKAPTLAATIATPTQGQHFSATPIKVSGTCPAGTLVEIFKNDIFAGSAPCLESGDYSLEIDLLIGQNILVARVYDSLNQPGPDSNSVTVFYDAVGAQASPVTSLDFGGAQLLLNTDAVFRGVFPDHELAVPIDILGGTPPYALNVQWGDSTNKVIPRNDNVTFNAIHTYKKAGIFQISLQASDSKGRVAFLTVAAIVNGQPGVTAASETPSPQATSSLLALWPLYTALVATVMSFWLGEWREKRILTKQFAQASI